MADMPVPSLLSLCVTALVPYANQVHRLPVRLATPSNVLLDELVPDSDELDVRLWAVIGQVFDLPSSSYSAQLANPHMPLLQSIPSTDSFSLVTVLDFPACKHLTDDAIVQLKGLHTLSAFDASETALTAYAVKSLAATLRTDGKGPWPLRILSLRKCRKVTDDVYEHLSAFPLLSVLDLRGTQCTPNPSFLLKPSGDISLFYPFPIMYSFKSLLSLHPSLLSSQNPYYLNIDALHLPTPRKPRGSLGSQDSFVVVPSNSNATIKVGNTNVLQRQNEEREAVLAHERNKEAWYQRQGITEGRLSSRYDPDVSYFKIPAERPYAPPSKVARSIPARPNNSADLFRTVPPIPPIQPNPTPTTDTPASHSSSNANSFYQPPPPPLPPPNPNPNRSSLPTPRVRRRAAYESTLPNDNPLLRLSLDPPPAWSAMPPCILALQKEHEEARLKRKVRLRGAKKREGDVATVDWSGDKAKQARAALDEILNLRIASLTSRSSFSAFPSESSAALSSLSPFPSSSSLSSSLSSLSSSFLPPSLNMGSHPSVDTHLSLLRSLTSSSSMENQFLMARNPFRRHQGLDLEAGRGTGMTLDEKLSESRLRRVMRGQFDESKDEDRDEGEEEDIQNIMQAYGLKPSSYPSQKQQRSNQNQEQQTQINTKPKHLKPISAFKPPILSPELKKALEGDVKDSEAIRRYHCSSAFVEDDGNDDSDTTVMPSTLSATSKSDRKKATVNLDTTGSGSVSGSSKSTHRPSPSMKTKGSFDWNDVQDSEAIRRKRRFSATVEDDDSDTTVMPLTSSASLKSNRKKATVNLDTTGSGSGSGSGNRPSASVKKKGSFDWKAWSKG